MTPLHFHKYHGLGNDYLVCHRAVADQLSNEHIRILCHRHYGVGSDGLLIDSGDRTHPTPRCVLSIRTAPRRKKAGMGYGSMRAICLISVVSGMSPF